MLSLGFLAEVLNIVRGTRAAGADPASGDQETAPHCEEASGHGTDVDRAWGGAPSDGGGSEPEPSGDADPDDGLQHDPVSADDIVLVFDDDDDVADVGSADDELENPLETSPLDLESVELNLEPAQIQTNDEPTTQPDDVRVQSPACTEHETSGQITDSANDVHVAGAVKGNGTSEATCAGNWVCHCCNTPNVASRTSCETCGEYNESSLTSEFSDCYRSTPASSICEENLQRSATLWGSQNSIDTGSSNCGIDISSSHQSGSQQLPHLKDTLEIKDDKLESSCSEGYGSSSESSLRYTPQELSHDHLRDKQPFDFEKWYEGFGTRAMSLELLSEADETAIAKRITEEKPTQSSELSCDANDADSLDRTKTISEGCPRTQDVEGTQKQVVHLSASSLCDAACQTAWTGVEIDFGLIPELVECSRSPADDEKHKNSSSDTEGRKSVLDLSIQTCIPYGHLNTDVASQTDCILTSSSDSSTQTASQVVEEVLYDQEAPPEPHQRQCEDSGVNPSPVCRHTDCATQTPDIYTQKGPNSSEPLEEENKSNPVQFKTSILERYFSTEELSDRAWQVEKRIEVENGDNSGTSVDKQQIKSSVGDTEAKCSLTSQQFSESATFNDLSSQCKALIWSMSKQQTPEVPSLTTCLPSDQWSFNFPADLDLYRLPAPLHQLELYSEIGEADSFRDSIASSEGTLTADVFAQDSLLASFDSAFTSVASISDADSDRGMLTPDSRLSRYVDTMSRQIAAARMQEKAPDQGRSFVEKSSTPIVTEEEGLNNVNQHLCSLCGQTLPQRAAGEREEHAAAMREYRDKVKDCEAWLTQARIDNAGEPAITFDTAYLKEQIRDNQKLGKELEDRLRVLSDMSVECERLCEQESTPQAQGLRTELANLREDTEQLKADASKKQEQLNQALREGEQKRKEIDTYRRSVDDLTEWIKKTKELVASGSDVRDRAPPTQPHTELKEDLAENQELLRRVREHADSARQSARSGSSEDNDDSDDVAANWRRLHRQLSEKNRQLQDSIEASRPSPFVGVPLHYFRLQAESAEGGSEKIEEVRDSLRNLKACWDSLQGQIDDKDARLEKAMEFQSLYQQALQNISQWLDEVEQRLFGPPWHEDTASRLRDNEALQGEIAALQGDISVMNKASQQLMAEAGAGSRHLIRQAVDDLNDRLRMLEEQAKEREMGLQQRTTQQRSVQDQAAELSRHMSDLKECYENLDRSEQMVETKITECHRLGNEVAECEKEVTSLIRACDVVRGREDVLLPPSQLSGLQSQLIGLKHLASESKASLEKALGLQNQYERMLEEYTEFLETAQSKLQTESVSAMDFSHLQQQVKTHKEFFEDLESNRAMLDALSEQVDRATKQHLLPTHTRLNNLTHVVQDRASIHGQKLERLERQWADFHVQFKEAKAYLRRLKQMAPKPVGELDTLEEMRHKIWNYNTLERSLLEEKATMLTTLDNGRHLLQGVSCPAVEGEVSECTESWLSINNDASTQLSKLQALVDQMEQFEREAAELEAWLSTATNRIHILASLEEPELQSLGAIKQKMELFLDFRKEVEAKLPMKTQVVTLGNQLLRSRPKDYSIQHRLDSIEEQWLQLMYQVPNNEEQLHAAQMELLPSRQALNELLLWLDGVQAMLVEEEREHPGTLMDIGIQLHKYKGLKVDLANKQLTVDFVNQSLLSSQSTQPSDAMFFNEKLGEMNSRYQALSSLVVEKIKSLQELQARWEDYDKMIKTLQIWFADQEGKLSRFQRIGHEISVQHSLKECKSIQDKLRAKETEIDTIKAIGKAIAEKCKSTPQACRPMLLTVDALNQQWAELDHALYELCNGLEEALRLWEVYHQALSKVSRATTETEYTLHRHRLASSDLVAFRQTIQQLQTLQSEFKGSRAFLEELMSSSKQLDRLVDTIVTQSIDRAVRDASERWQQVSHMLDDRLSLFESIQQKWQAYESEFEVCKVWLEAKEAEVNALIRKPTDEPKVQLNRARNIETELNRYRENILRLGNLSDQLTPHMDNATVIYVTSKETTLSQRLHNLQQAISKYMHGTQAETTRHAKFSEAYDLVDAFLADANQVLRSGDPNKSADEEEIRARLSQLKNLSSQFSRKQASLDLLNEIGFRLPLSEANSRRLRELNQRWQALAGDAAGKHKNVQSSLLLHEDFNDKCEDWSRYLAQVERDLATDIAGNYPALLEQQQAYSNFQTEMHSRQQILASIIDEGHQMIQCGDFDESMDFERKLEQLEERWHSVVRRANQRKTVVDNAVMQWQQYQNCSERLHDKLDEMKRSLASLNFENLYMQKARELSENIKRIQERLGLSPSCDTCLVEIGRLVCPAPFYAIQTTQSDLTSQEPLYQKVTDSGRMLMANSDPKAREEIQANLSNAQDSWFELLKQLDERRKHLEEILSKWKGVERGLDEGLLYLKEVRQQLHLPLPDSYDQLQVELQKCKEIESSLETAKKGQNELLTGQQGLSDRVVAGDVAVLQQRLSLLSKQWAEMDNQVVLRRQQILDKLQNWSQFNDKYKELSDKLTEMEERVNSNTEFQIEDLLHKFDSRTSLQNRTESSNVPKMDEFKEEMVQIAGEKEVLASRGRKLMCVSSDVRANDIEYKLSRLDEKWERLQDLTSSRSRKLRETMSAVQQLEQSMAKLRHWLAHIERELGSPVTYRQADFAEIQRCLQHTQELQSEVERHSTGVSSVLNLCEVLLHDLDACPTSSDQRSINEAKDCLDKRWKNICALATERRMSIEETWHQWQKWHDDTDRFHDWLTDCERKAKFPKMEGTFTVLRHEQTTFEAFKSHIHNSLSQLESLNRLYRKLAREGRTDQAGTIKKQSEDMNRRWDELLQRTTAINRRLRHILNVKGDFDATRKALIVWLSDVSMRLSNLEYLRDTSTSLRLQNIQAMKDELNQNQHRLEYIDKAGAYLISKSDPEDAVQIQHDVDHFHQVLEQVLARMNTMHAKLQSVSLSLHAMRTPPKRRLHAPDYLSPLRSGYSADGTSLDWDLNGVDPDSQADLSSGQESSEEEYDLGAMAGAHTASQSERQWRMHVEHLSPQHERLHRLEGYLAQLAPTMERAKAELEGAEKTIRSRTPVGPEAERALGGFDQLLHSCAGAVDALRQLERNLQRETGVTSSDPHIAAIVKRWQRLQTSAIEKNYRLGTNKKMWAQFKVDLDAIQQWLSEADTLQSTQGRTPAAIAQLEAAVCSHKEFLMQLDSKKPVVLSMNLVNKDLMSRCPSTAETRVMGEQLDAVNTRWDKCCAKAALWQKELQIALLQSAEFHHSLRDLNAWLNKTEGQIKMEEPVDFASSRALLTQKYQKFREIKAELERAQPRVTSYQETADQLLDSSDTSGDSCSMRDRMSSISAKLAALLHTCSAYVKRLEGTAQLSTADISALRSTDIDDADGLRHTYGTLGTLTSPRNIAAPRTRTRQSAFQPRFGRRM